MVTTARARSSHRSLRTRLLSAVRIEPARSYLTFCNSRAFSSSLARVISRGYFRIEVAAYVDGYEPQRVSHCGSAGARSLRRALVRNARASADSISRIPMTPCMVAGGFAKFVAMCTLAIYFKALADYPVIVAANRDEYLARPALPPTTLAEIPHIVGGKDLRASGTWLGINEHGMVAGLLNRRNGTLENDSELRSRGLL